MKVITIIGSVGSGKSTMTAFLAKELGARLIEADELYKINPFFEETLKDRSRWSLTSDLWFLLKRIEIQELVLKEKNVKVVVQDSGIPMSYVYAQSRILSSHMTQKEYMLYKMVFEKLSGGFKEDLIIYLNLPVGLLLQRIKTRGRDFEIKYHSAEYLSNLHKSLSILIQELREKKKNVLEFNSENWVDIVNSEEDRKRLLNAVKQALVET